MSGFEKIASRQNPRVLRLVKLRERAARVAEGVFLLEGLRELERAALSGVEILEFYFCPELIRNPLAEKVFALAKKRLPAAAIVELSRPAFEKVSYREKPEGVLAVAKMRAHRLENLHVPAGTPPLFLIAESIEKPGNLGALLRTADSAGCTALICCGDAGTDIYNPNTIRASQGTLFSVPLAVAPNEVVFAWLKAQGVTVFATSPAAKKIYWDCDLRVPAAILMGTEATGLTDFWIGKRADVSIVPVSIPQAGLADSLNVSMAATICLFEAVRQRNL
ncbi:MAG: RNA methyltransferase [Opitutales bacterium]|nr:RNA methyltransferase [Opitutales bacterium]